MVTSKISDMCEELLAAVRDEKHDEFMKLIARHNSKDDPFDLDEVVQFLQSKQLDTLWNHLHVKCSSALLDFGRSGSQESDQDALSHASVLHGIIKVAICTISNHEVVPQMFFETAALVHGILLMMHEEFSQLQNLILSLCEMWWHKNIEGREVLVPQTLSLMIRKIISPKAPKTDIKRIWKMREALTIIDWTDSKSDALKDLLMLSVRSQSVIRCEEGRKFLGYLFGLELNMMNDLHSAMKSIIPWANNSTLDWIGEIYFHAWKVVTVAGLDMTEKFERTCLQDLMYCCVHASRVACRGTSKPLSTSLHQILSNLHQRKKQKGIDEMLLRLYEPFIWRSIKVANADVRANAASLLVDVFPFVDSSATADEGAELLRKQLDAIKTLLGDKSHIVRAIAVTGVCNICTNCWNLLPSDQIKAIILVLIQKLAWDASSADVRLAVVKGVKQMIDNSLTHLLLRSILPSLRDLFHDITEKVRLAMIDLLLKIKGLNGFQFWNVVPMDHILSRLAIEQSTARIRLVQLLFESFMPLNKPLEDQLDRCIYLLRSNPGAARNFYLHAYRHMDLRAACNFVLYVLKCVSRMLLTNTGNTDEPSNASMNDVEPDEIESFEENSCDHDTRSSHSNDKATNSLDPNSSVGGTAGASDSKSNDVGSKNDVDGDADTDDKEFCIENEQLMAGLFETVVLLWMSHQQRLMNRTDLDEVKRRFLSKVATYLPSFFRTFNNPRVTGPLYMLASFIPPSDVRAISYSMMSKLRALKMSADVSEYDCLLEMLCRWKKGNEVLEFIHDWLQPCLMPDSGNKKQNVPVVRFAEPAPSNPQMALRLIEFLMHQTACRTTLLENCRPNLWRLTDCLQKSQDLIERRLAVNAALEEPLTDEVLVDAFQRRLRLIVLLCAEEEKTSDLMREMEDVVRWANRHLVDAFKKEKSSGDLGRRGRRLIRPGDCTMIDDPMEMEPISQTMPLTQALSEGSSSDSVVLRGLSATFSLSPRTEFAKSVVESLLAVGTNMFLVGIGDCELASCVGELLICLLQLNVGMAFLSSTVQLVYQMIPTYEAVDEGVGHHGNVVPSILKEVMHTCLSFSGKKKQEANKIIAEVSNGLEKVLLAYFESASYLHEKEDANDVMQSIVSNVIKELENVVTKDSTFEPQSTLKGLPPLSSVLLRTVFTAVPLTRFFISQLERVCQTETIKSVESQTSCIYLLYITVSNTDSSKHKDMKTCLELLAADINNYILPDDTLEDSPLRHLQSTSLELLNKCRSVLNPSAQESPNTELVF